MVIHIAKFLQPNFNREKVSALKKIIDDNWMEIGEAGFIGMTV